MQLVIAEKPSVAMALSKVLGAKSRGDGYMEGGGWLVSWCIGHLVELSDGELREKQTANYFSDIYPIDCAVLSANAQSCPKCCTLLPVLLSA